MVRATLAQLQILSPDIALPIHPLVTLEDWVGMVYEAMLDSALSPDAQAKVLRDIRDDADASRLYERVCRDEAYLRGLFAEASLVG